MITNTYHLKKKQREFSIKKRLLLKQKENKNFLFVTKLIGNSWFEKSLVIASFLSIKSEISTKKLNEYIFKSGKILCFPSVTNKKDNILQFKKYSNDENLIEGKFGVMEPANESDYLPDIIFAPCLAYDQFGFRLGYGGGYYDKTIFYLRSINHNFLVIGVAFDDQKVDKVVHNHLDQKMNYILTEKHLYKIL